MMGEVLYGGQGDPGAAELASEETPGEKSEDESDDTNCDDSYDNDRGRAKPVPADDGRDIGHSLWVEADGRELRVLLVDARDLGRGGQRSDRTRSVLAKGATEGWGILIHKKQEVCPRLSARAVKC